MKKILIITFNILLLSKIAISQNDVQFTHFTSSEMLFNPALAGKNETIDATLIARQQWMGFDQAPQTQLLNVGAHFDAISGGVGLSVSNDQLGVENTINAKLMYAYKLKLDKKNNLSFGLGVGIINKSVKGSELIYDNMTDENAQLTNESKLKADFDFGIGFFNEKISAGISTTHIDQGLKKSTIMKVPRHYYLYFKYKIKASDKISIIPAVIARSSEFITQFDINACMDYDNKFWFGLSYRYGDAYVGMLGVTIAQKFKIGYSYDYSAGALKSYSGGSHEIMISAAFPGAKSKGQPKSFFQ